MSWTDIIDQPIGLEPITPVSSATFLYDLFLRERCSHLPIEPDPPARRTLF